MKKASNETNSINDVKENDFQPPDGGWGWFIVFACGFSNCSILPMLQQFGLVYRNKMKYLGISNTEITTIINTNLAFTACIALLNGPIYRYFSYRQVAMFGSCLVSFSLLATAFCKSFTTFIIFYSVCYGLGLGITQSANYIALNTYFKKKRRIATGISWGTTGIGPVIWPYIITFLIDQYGTENTVMLFSAFALHAFPCSMLLQPVEWHVTTETVQQTKQFGSIKSIFSSQRLYEDEDPVLTGNDVTDIGTPSITKSYDWYYQNRSRSSSKRSSYSNVLDIRSKRNSCTSLSADTIKKKKSFINMEIKEETEDCLQKTPTEVTSFLSNEKYVLTTVAQRLNEYKQQLDNEETKKKGIFRNVCSMFDFALLKDPIYVMLMLGIIIANFVELNFSVLTPMVLKEFKFQQYEIATFMSILASMDIFLRFLVPFIAEKVDWDNETFFLIGIMAMATGRNVLVETQWYSVGVAVAVIIGVGKGLRTVFMALIIPNYVPLERLPAATGLHLATSGIFFIILGPLIGWIQEEVNDYRISLHILNVLTYLTVITWTLQKIVASNNK